MDIFIALVMGAIYTATGLVVLLGISQVIEAARKGRR